jgi:hypothetical protein
VRRDSKARHLPEPNNQRTTDYLVSRQWLDTPLHSILWGRRYTVKLSNDPEFLQVPPYQAFARTACMITHALQPSSAAHVTPLRLCAVDRTKHHLFSPLKTWQVSASFPTHSRFRVAQYQNIKSIAVILRLKPRLQ